MQPQVVAMLPFYEPFLLGELVQGYSTDRFHALHPHANPESPCVVLLFLDIGNIRMMFLGVTGTMLGSKQFPSMPRSNWHT